MKNSLRIKTTILVLAIMTLIGSLSFAFVGLTYKEDKTIPSIQSLTATISTSNRVVAYNTHVYYRPNETENYYYVESETYNKDNNTYSITYSNHVVLSNSKGSQFVYINNNYGLFLYSYLVSINRKNSERVCYKDMNASLMADITVLSPDKMSPIGTETYNYTGLFNGGKHKISGLKQSLFGVTNKATIQNLWVADSSSEQFSLVVNNATETTINNVLISKSNINTTFDKLAQYTGSVTRLGGVGALIGIASGICDISKCGVVANVDTSGIYCMGGLVGRNLGTLNVSSSYFKGSSSGSGLSIFFGGLSGGNEGTLNANNNYVSITGANFQSNYGSSPSFDANGMPSLPTYYAGGFACVGLGFGGLNTNNYNKVYAVSNMTLTKYEEKAPNSVMLPSKVSGSFTHQGEKVTTDILPQI